MALNNSDTHNAHNEQMQKKKIVEDGFPGPDGVAGEQVISRVSCQHIQSGQQEPTPHYFMG
jgi:hypothetical protein